MHAPKPRIHQHWSLRDIVYRLVDVGGIFAGLVLAVHWQIGALSELYWLAAAAATIIFLLLCEISGMYRNWRGVSIERELLCAVLTWLAVMPMLLAVAVMARYASWVDRSFIVTWTWLTGSIIVAVRIILRLAQRALRAHGYNTRGFAIVGINDLAI
ncbi:MAG: hypothetical protein KDB23_32805, partial [Planctomycetales bacterium]|nr:hypothetical protein [Planctomycetales bacterium]